MDFKKLAEITDSVVNNKPVSSSVRQVHTNMNPIDAVNSLHDSTVRRNRMLNRVQTVREPQVKSVTKYVILDSAFVSKFNSMSVSQKKLLRSKLSDSQNKRLTRLVKDEQNKPIVQYILLDNYIANVLDDPSDFNISNLEEFVQDHDDLGLNDEQKKVIEDITNGSTEVPQDFITYIELYTGVSAIANYAAVTKEAEDQDEDQEEFTDEENSYLDDSAREIATAFLVDHSVANMQASIQSSARKIKKNQEQVRDSMLKLVQDYVIMIPYYEPIKDESSIDKMYKEDEEEPTVTTESVLNQLSEAIEAYEEGDESKLQELSKIPALYLEPTEDKNVEKPTDEEKPSDSPSEDSEDIPDSLKASVKALISKALAHKSIKDDLQSINNEYPGILSQYLPTEYSPEKVTYEETSSPNIPLTVEEYYSVTPSEIPPEVLEEAQALTLVPVVNTCTQQDEFLLVNGDRIYVPTEGTSEEIVKALQKIDNKREYLQKHSVCYDSLVKSAANHDCLRLLSNKFYKDKMVSDTWVFDPSNKPWCIKDNKTNRIKRCLSHERDFTIAGSSYKYV